MLQSSEGTESIISTLTGIGVKCQDDYGRGGNPPALPTSTSAPAAREPAYKMSP